MSAFLLQAVNKTTPPEVVSHKGMVLLRFIKHCQVHGAKTGIDGAKCSYFQSNYSKGERIVADDISANLKNNKVEFRYRDHRCICYLDAVLIFIRGEEPK